MRDRIYGTRQYLWSLKGGDARPICPNHPDEQTDLKTSPTAPISDDSIIVLCYGGGGEHLVSATTLDEYRTEHLDAVAYFERQVMLECILCLGRKVEAIHKELRSLMRQAGVEPDDKLEETFPWNPQT